MHGVQCDVLPQIIYMKGPKFGRQIMNFIHLIRPLIYDQFVVSPESM